MTPASSDRSFKTALPAALACRCPACGSAPLFRAFLKPVERCRACAQDWTHQQADDFPAYLVILILGHLLVPIVVEVNMTFEPPLLWQMILWPALTTVLALLMIQPAKAAVIAWQWSRRMHGF